MSLFYAILKQYNINIINNYDNINYSENDICIVYAKIFDHNKYVKNRKHPNIFMSKINKGIVGKRNLDVIKEWSLNKKAQD